MEREVGEGGGEWRERKSEGGMRGGTKEGRRRRGGKHGTHTPCTASHQSHSAERPPA